MKSGQGLNALFSIAALVFISIGAVNGQWDPHFTQNRTTVVHLFEWRWNDIAEECERFLGPYGFGGIQTSPPNENVFFDKDGVTRPWYERYQPVSYKLETRSGTEQEFASMVRRCNAAGVRIYIDAVINHMTYFHYWGDGTGTAGSSFNSHTLDYPAVPYTSEDFNKPSEECPTTSGEIDNYKDIVQMRNCRLSDLNDLKTQRENVRNKIADFFNVLVGYGVAGFRVDAAMHIWPEDLKAIFEKVNNLPTAHGFPSGARPVVFQEVLDGGADVISASEYFQTGRTTEFRGGGHIGTVFRRLDNQQLRYLRNWGEGWGFVADGMALTFVDNHDNQRGIGSGGSVILTHKTSKLYKMAQAFTLAWPYGVTRIMSSFYFEEDFQGPPHDSNNNILPVTVNPDMTCGNGWVCEHRWRQIYNMVGFRNVVKGTQVENFWDNGKDQIAFSRGNRGFIAINNDDSNLNEVLDTGLPGGQYCDLITGNLVNGSCTGGVITVGSDGKVTLNISSASDDPLIAIHVEAKL